MKFNAGQGDPCTTVTLISHLSLSLSQSLSVEEYPPHSSNSPPPSQQKLTFGARYLGYQDVMESKLIPGQCVEVVHSCVKELTAALGDRPTNADQVNKINIL